MNNPDGNRDIGDALRECQKELTEAKAQAEMLSKRRIWGTDACRGGCDNGRVTLYVVDDCVECRNKGMGEK